MRSALLVAPFMTVLIGSAAPGSCSDTDPGPGDAGTAGSGGRSAGCRATAWPASGSYTIEVGGTPRQYVIKIPDSYSSQTAHRLIFAWHGLGGTAQQIANSRYYGLESRAAGSAIFVAGQGLPTSQGGAGWPNTGGRDIAFVRALLDSVRGSYCIDDARIFSVGMSYGGIMSNTVGCQLGDVFRAIAPMAGMGPYTFGGTGCKGQVAAWLTHGNQDTVVPFSSGIASRDHWITSNHCTPQSVPVNPTGCVSYQGCDAGHPVHWCEFTGGHTIPSFASQAIWNFFAQF